jgi:sterol 3beta-glucosyltransferase
LRLVIPTIGSRGDVQPYIALGLGLQAAGHDVCLATHSDFEPLIRRRGLDFQAIAEDGRALQSSPIGNNMLQAGNNPFAFMREFIRLRGPLIPDLMSNCLEACRDADVILLSPTLFMVGYCVAEKLNVPVCCTHLQPMTMSRDLPNCLFPDAPRWLPLRGVYNRLTHALGGEYLWQLCRKTINEARDQILGLPPIPFLGPPYRFFTQTPALHGYSHYVVPHPSDWGANHRVTGYWFLDEPMEWQPPDDLLNFLDSGPPPVYVGFGSMHNEDPETATRLVVEALQITGQRGILLTGWGGLKEVAGAEDCFVVDAVPHDWLFPQMAAVVHHGGAGTTAASFRAGVPSVVVPFMCDQPFWAKRSHQLGVAPPPLPRKQLTVHGLARSINQAVKDTRLQQKAAALGSRIRAESGVHRAVDFFHEFWPAPMPKLARNIASATIA